VDCSFFFLWGVVVACVLYLSTYKVGVLMRFCFKIMSAFWITSPALFVVLRYCGIYDFQPDVAVFCGLSLISFIAMFLNYKTWED